MGAIRLFLATAVLQSHIAAQFLIPGHLYSGNKLVLGVNGGYAVMFFYIISGFLISYVLEDKYDRPGGTVAFYRARALRIYPLWWALYVIVPFLVEGGLWTFVSQRHVYDLLAGFFIFGSDWLLSFWSYPAPYTSPMPHGLELGWTLACELTFYLVAPFVLRSKLLPPVILCASIATRVVLNLRYQQHLGQTVWDAWCYYFLPSTIMFFMLGHLGRQLYKWIALPSRWAWAGIAAAAVACVLQDGRGSFDSFGFYVAVLLFAASLPAVFAATKDNNLSNLLGDLTYPLYLSHGAMIVLMETKGSFLYPIGQKILALGSRLPTGEGLDISTRAALISVAIWLLAYFVAAAVHVLVERPARRCVDALLPGAGWSRPRRAAMVEAPEGGVP